MVVVLVPGMTGQRATMGTTRGTASRVASARRRLPVYHPEPRSGQRHEHGRVLSDGLVHAFASLEPGTHKVSGISSVQGGARRAAQLAA